MGASGPPLEFPTLQRAWFLRGAQSPASRKAGLIQGAQNCCTRYRHLPVLYMPTVYLGLKKMLVHETPLPVQILRRSMHRDFWLNPPPSDLGPFLPIGYEYRRGQRFRGPPGQYHATVKGSDGQRFLR